MDAKLIEEFGLVGVFIVVAWAMVRYFMAQVEKKDKRIQELTTVFMEEIAKRDAALTVITSNYSTLAERSTEAMERNSDSTDDLAKEIRELRLQQKHGRG